MVLITGASGFLGSHLVRYLSGMGVTTRALFHAHPPADDLKALPYVAWKYCDLLDIFDVEEVLDGITDVYHCAAIVTFDPRKRDEMLHFNIEGTANLVNQSVLQGIRKMVHVSSIAALGRTGENGKEITEEEEWGESSYNSAYGISKYISEAEVWRGIGEGLNAVIINPGIILGGGSFHSLTGQLMKMAWKEFPFYTNGVNAWVDAGDVAKLMVSLMDSVIVSERFIISSGNFTYKEIFTLIANSMNKKPPRIKASQLMTSIAWRLSALTSAITGSNSLITRETVNNANSLCFYNNSKLLKALPGFSYTPVDQSIQLMAQSFMNSYKK